MRVTETVCNVRIRQLNVIAFEFPIRNDQKLYIFVCERVCLAAERWMRGLGAFISYIIRLRSKCTQQSERDTLTAIAHISLCQIVTLVFVFLRHRVHTNRFDEVRHSTNHVNQQRKAQTNARQRRN